MVGLRPSRAYHGCQPYVVGGRARRAAHPTPFRPTTNRPPPVANARVPTAQRLDARCPAGFSSPARLGPARPAFLAQRGSARPGPARRGSAPEATADLERTGSPAAAGLEERELHTWLYRTTPDWPGLGRAGQTSSLLRCRTLQTETQLYFCHSADCRFCLDREHTRREYSARHSLLCTDG